MAWPVRSSRCCSGFITRRRFYSSAPSSAGFTQQNSERKSNQTSSLCKSSIKKWNCRAARPFNNYQSQISLFRDEAEKSVRFIGDSGSEIDSGAERKKIPQAINLKRSRIGFADRLNKSAGRWIIIIDCPVTKIANPEFTLHQGKSPRGIQVAVRDEASEKGAARIKHIHEAVAWPGHIIFPFRILQGVGDKNLAIEISDPEWRVTPWKSPIDKTSRVHFMKILVIGLNAPGMEICHIQKIMTIGDAQRRAFINGALASQVCPVIDCDGDGMRLIIWIERRIPARDGTIFTDEDESGGCGISIKDDIEERSTVEYNPSRVSPVFVTRGRRNRHD